MSAIRLIEFERLFQRDLNTSGTIYVRGVVGVEMARMYGLFCTLFRVVELLDKSLRGNLPNS